MNAATENRRSSADSLIFISVINAIFWALALGVSATYLPGTACFERLLPVLVGGVFVSVVGIAATWKRRA